MTLCRAAATDAARPSRGAPWEVRQGRGIETASGRRALGRGSGAEALRGKMRRWPASRSSEREGGRVVETMGIGSERAMHGEIERRSG